MVDQKFLLAKESPTIVPLVRRHYLDFLLYMGSRPGLDVFLPRRDVIVAHTWYVNWSLSQRFRLWPETLADLPFDPKGRMVNVGTRFQEDLWVAFVPRSLIDDPDADLGPHSLRSPTTALSPEHQNMFIMFCAYVFSSLMIQDIHCNNKYPDPLTTEAVARSTDIL